MTRPLGQAPQDVLDHLRAAWNAGDAAAFAGLFTEDATFVIWRGDVLTGRSEIEQAHHDLFTRSPSRTQVAAVDLRRLDDQVAVALTVGGASGDGDVRYDMLQTLVLVRRDEGWRVAAFHNTAMSERAKQRFQHDPGK